MCSLHLTGEVAWFFPVNILIAMTYSAVITFKIILSIVFPSFYWWGCVTFPVNILIVMTYSDVISFKIIRSFVFPSFYWWGCVTFPVNIWRRERKLFLNVLIKIQLCSIYNCTRDIPSEMSRLVQYIPNRILLTIIEITL